jgi:tRNA threonylcarbamoyl adenosine modification protein YeaZ
MEFYMLVLALDTTTRKGSVALVRDGILLDCDSGNPAVTHGQRLPGDVIQLLERQNLSVRDVELFAVAAGPGSFTGLRIGIATMQGLALANGRSLIGVSALDALNHALLLTVTNKVGTTGVDANVGADLEVGTTEADAAVVPTFRSAVWMDAQRDEVFSALYDGSTVLDGPSVEKPAVVLARWRSALDLSAAVRAYPANSGETSPSADVRRLPANFGATAPKPGEGGKLRGGGKVGSTGMGVLASEFRPITFVGEGACLYAELIRHEITNAQILAKVPSLAPSIARLAEEQALLHGPSAPEAIRPIYVRRPDAELARDKEARLNT